MGNGVRLGAAVAAVWWGQLILAGAAPEVAARPVPKAKAVSPSRSARDRLPGGTLVAVTPEGKTLSCPLQNTAIEADLSGFVARVRVKQTFHNPATTPVEARYTFPLPADAAVDEMVMTVGDRRVVGVVKRREEARKTYEAAKAQGKTAALLNQERPNIFTQAVANLMPGTDVTVEIGYTNRLQFQDGVYEWAFPTVVGPRYTGGPAGGLPAATRELASGPEAGAGTDAPPLASSPVPPSEVDTAAATVPPPPPHVLTDTANIVPPVAPPGMDPGHSLTLTARINTGVTLGKISSISHAILVRREGKSRATVTLKAGQVVPLKDLILRFTAGSKRVETAFLTQSGPQGNHFALVFQPPLQPAPDQIAPREMIYVIDQTGSQAGFPIAKSKETIAAALKASREGDTFNLVGFNTAVYPCFPRPVPVTKANVARALKYLKGIDSGGGTDILGSMSFVLRQPADPARLRVVAYFTDGYIGNDMQVVDFIRKNRGTTRIFPFGIGSSVNRFLIEKMASEGRGVATIVTLAEKGDEAAKTFIKRLQRPVLLNPAVDFHDLPVQEVLPRVQPDLYAEGPIVIFGRYSGAASGKITVKGMAGGKRWQSDLQVELRPNAHDNGALPSLWARARVEELQSQDWLGAQSGQPVTEIKEQIVQTALTYRLMSQYTSFVAVEEKVVNPGGENLLQEVPVKLPEGVSHEGAAPRYAVSSGSSNWSGRPGDPLILVQAPRAARHVVALLPGGEVKRLCWDEKRQAWQARFDIPAFVADGTQLVRVIIVDQGGKRRSLTLSFQVDTRSPLGRALGQAGPGIWNLRVNGDADVDRVQALLPWGERLPLWRNGAEFARNVKLPAGWSGTSRVELILTDRAHNRTRLVLDLSQNAQ